MASIASTNDKTDELTEQLNQLKLNLKKDEILAYLDVNFDETTERYNNCVELVKSKNLAYGLSSNRLVELQGSELARLPELYESDYEFSQKRMLVRLPNQRIIIKLFSKVSPLILINKVIIVLNE